MLIDDMWFGDGVFECRYMCVMLYVMYGVIDFRYV